MSPNRLDHEQYVELVLGCVEQVPRGRVTTYGAIAEVVGQVGAGLVTPPAEIFPKALHRLAELARERAGARTPA